MSKSLFDWSFERLIGHEGGLQKRPSDKGNWTGGVVGQGKLKGTKYGISAASYPEEDIENMTLERAKAIYYRDYWLEAGCERVSPNVRFDLFDTAVHAGPTRAIKFLQMSVGLTGGDVDGRFGPKTQGAVDLMESFRLKCRYNGHRLDHLNNNQHLWDEYGRGWAQRIAENLIES